MTLEYYQCFICTSEVITGESITPEINLLNSEFTLLSKNLEVIFVLTKVLNVPSIHLENQLNECGGSDPAGWIKLCDQCTQLTRTAWKLELEIKKIEKELRCVQKQVVERMISSFEDTKRTTYLDKNSLTFEEKIRSFVTRYNLDDKDGDNPGGFLEGDKLANYLASQQNSATAQILMVENPVVVLKKEIKLEVGSPPPSPSSPPPSPMSPGGNEEEDPMTPPSSLEVSDDEEYPKKKIAKPRPNYKRKPRKIEFCSCPHCGKEFNRKNPLRDHVRNVHLKNFRIKCPVCQKGFPSNQTKHLHMLAMHKDDPATLKLQQEKGLFYKRCSVEGCIAIFMKAGQEDKHMAQRHDPSKAEDKEFKCKYCGNEYKTWHNLRDHERLHERKGIDVKLRLPKKKWEPSGDRRSKMGANGKIQCGECGVFCSNGYLWSTHFWAKHGGGDQGQDVKCPMEECGMTFKVCDGTLSEFYGHWKERHSKRKMCEICKKPYFGCPHFRAKIYGADGGPRICELCGVEKATYAMMVYHKHNVHKVYMRGQPIKNVEEDEEKLKEMKKVLCNLCGNTYADKKSLSTHVKLRHNKQFNLSCHVCGLAMAHKRQFHIHLFQVHREDPVTRKLEEEGLSLIKCEVKGCPRLSLKKEEMDKHMEKVHKGGLEKEAKKFECTVCGKGFYVRAKLVYHEKVHERDRNNGKPVKCETCGKGFDTRHYLRCHQRAVHKY